MKVFQRNGLAGNLLLVLLALAAVLLGSESALIAASPGLFSPAGAGPSLAGAAAGRGVLRSRFVTVDFEQLATAAASPEGDQGGLVLNLFDDVVLTALPDDVTPNPRGGFAWSGHVAGVELSQVTLVVRDGVLAGNVALPGAFYQIRYAGEGVHVVRDIDQSAFPPEQEPIPVELPGTAPAAPQAGVTDDGSIIDVLVVYTAAAAGAPGDILADIDLAVQETNDGYANSGISQRVRLVHAAQVSYAQADIETDLYRLQNPADGFMDQVHSWRNTYGADEVVLLVYYPSGLYCGIAYMMDYVSSSFEDYAFAAVDIECATGYYSFGHEMGHNMGARHDWYVDDLKTPYGYAHGYVNYDNPGDRWRTIMAYNNECDKQGVYCYRIPYWSNPAVLRNGAPMGVPDGTSTSCVANVLHPHCDADNHKTLNNTAYTVANFRASIPQTPAAPGSLSALGISQSRIDLSWSDNSFDESGFKIERSPAGTGNWGQIATVGANVETYANTGLPSDTAYDYRVRAYNGAGDSAYSNVASASTLPPPPAAPSNLTATAISQTRIDLAWSDNSSDESGFKIERALSAGGPWSQIATVGANVTSFSNTGLSPDTGYYYRVRAYNFYGNSAYSNVASAATPPVVGPVVVFGYTVDDDNSGGSSGNGDGRIDCGETVQLYVDLKNLGGGLAQDVQATISSPSTYANWLDSSSAYGDIGAGLVVRNTDTFDLEVSPSTPHGHLLQFDLEISALDGGPWSGSFATMVRCGGPIYNMYLPLVASRQTATAGFNSQFNGSAPGWQVHSGSWWIDNSAWYRTDGLSGAWASASYGATYAELDYRARIWREGCGNCAQGLLVRGSPDPLGGQNTWDSGYGFFISRDGRYAILNYTGGVGAALQPWTSSTAIAQGGAWNELRVVAAGSTLSFYINDALLWVGSNAAHASGRVGLAMYRDSSSTGNILWVDWATLTPQATAADPQEVSPEQRALNEAAREQDELGSDGRAPAR